MQPHLPRLLFLLFTLGALCEASAQTPSPTNASSASSTPATGTVATTPPAPANKPEPKKNKLSKGSPWTADDIIAALNSGANKVLLAEVIKANYDGSSLDTPGYRRVLISPEGLKLKARTTSAYFEDLATNLADVKRLRSDTTDALAKEMIAKRRARVTPLAQPSDSPALRARYAKGEPAAAYELYQYFGDIAERTEKWPDNAPPEAELKARAIAQNYAPAQWLRASEYDEYGPNNDPLRRIEFYRISAEAGDPRAAFALSQVYSAVGGEKGLARNYAEAEYWLIEAGARAWPGQMEVAYRNAWIDLSNLYSCLNPNFNLTSDLPSTDEATYRWARTLLDRGGQFAASARLFLDYTDATVVVWGNPVNVNSRLAAVPPEVDPIPIATLAKLEAASTKDPAAALQLGNAYASGRGVHQDDIGAARYYEQAVKNGASLPAMQALARAYRYGYGVKKDPVQHLAWLNKAAATGDASALRNLGDILFYADTGADKHNIPADLTAAATAYEKAAGLGDAQSIYNLSKMHRFGRGLPVDKKKADELTLSAAEKGHAPAMRDVAYELANNNKPEAEKDYKKAIYWYRKAIAAGDKTARQPLATILLNTGDRAGSKNLWLELATEDENYVEAQYYTASFAEEDGDYAEAIKWYGKVANSPNRSYEFMNTGAAAKLKELTEETTAKPGTLAYLRKLARKGSPEAKFIYARALYSTDKKAGEIELSVASYKGSAPATSMYYEIIKSDQPRARKWLQNVADTGNNQALLLLTLMDSATDRAGSIARVKEIAEKGNIEAQYRYGMILFNGQDLPQDRVSGLKLITQSADGGFPIAQGALGKALISGDVGVTIDPARGVSYLRKAAAQIIDLQTAAQVSAMLGQIYEKGISPTVAPNLREALIAYKRAKMIGVKGLDETINRLEQQSSAQMKGISR